MNAPTESASGETERIEDIDVVVEMQNSYVDYALSVVHARALPDARDGLKPVQRRIIYQMVQMGLGPTHGHVKSARVVGEVMGKLHPHGDSAIYDAMVRMASSDLLSVPLIDGHGNFGSLDDGPAASRYTEARLAAPALLLAENLDEDVVDMVPNYDNQLLQPSVMPAAFPNLLVNGGSGIAVGMATNLAPHNLRESIEAARYLLDNPDADLEALMQYLPGPDLPSGGIIIGLDGIRDAYATGRGSFTMRAKATIAPISARKTGIIVTELPYMVGPEQVIEKVKDAVGAKRLTGISNVHDLTDRTNGLKLVFEIKTGFSPEAVLDQLYRLTPLETNFGINNVVLVGSQPQTLGLKELLRVYLDHRIDVVRRRSQFRKQKAENRLHLVEGLLIAILDIDEVISVIRSSDDADIARTRLMAVFDLSEEQANHILELRLRRLTKFSRIDLEQERDQLRATIDMLTVLLENPDRLRGQVSEELADVATSIDSPRRTVLLEATAAPKRNSSPATAEIADAPCVVILSSSGRIVRTDVEPEPVVGSLPEVGESIAQTARRRQHDAVAAIVATTSRSTIGAITSHGRCVRVNVVELPAMPPSSLQLGGGPRVDEFVALADKTEKVVGLVALDPAIPLALGTRAGVVKRVTPDYPDKPDFEVITLKQGDRVVGAAPAPDSAEIVFVTREAQLLHYPAGLVRPQGRSAGGMAGVKLAADDHVIGFFVLESADAPASVVTCAGSTDALEGANPGSVKVSPFSEFPAKGRATGGVRAQRFVRGEDELRLAWVGTGIVHGLDARGRAVRIPGLVAKRDASGTPLDTVVASIGRAI